jgi:hypothetical protein
VSDSLAAAGVQSLPDHSVAVAVVKLLLAIDLLFTVPMVLVAAREAIEEALGTH